MIYGYTLISDNGQKFGFGQVLAPLSRQRGRYRESSSERYRTGCWWVATDVIDEGGGTYTVSGDYIYNLATLQYESARGEVITSNGLFMAQPMYVYDGIIYAYIPLPFVLRNIVTSLVFNEDKSITVKKGDVVFNPYAGGSLCAHQSPPSVDPNLVATGLIPFLGMQDCRANTLPWALQRSEGFIYPIFRPSDYRYSVQYSRTYGLYFKSATPCLWMYEYLYDTATNMNVGVKEDIEKWLHDIYELQVPYPPGYDHATDNCFCMFDNTFVKPDYLVYV